MAGDPEAAREPLRRAAALYRASWESAPPGSYGRLVGMLKAAILGGDGPAAAAYAREALREAPAASPTASYALAIAALAGGDDPVVSLAAAGMRAGDAAFGRAADAVQALAGRDGPAYAAAVRAIVADFEGRDEHLTGVAIADTALMLEVLAEERGMAARPPSALLPVGT
jgi:hypothetical protein